MVVSSGNYFIELHLTQTTASNFQYACFSFFPKAILMFMIGEQEPNYIPLSLIINTKYIVPNSMIVLYYNHVLLGRYGSSKRREVYSIYLHFSLMTHIYTIWPLFLTYNNYNR